MSDPIVGIDLGTSNSVVAHAEVTGTVTVLADNAGGKVHPSVVSFHPSGGVVVGAAAKQRKVIDPENTIYSVKRLIGRSYRSAEVQTVKARAPFRIKEGPSSAPLIATRAGEFAVPEISAIVLDHVRNIADARLGAPVNRAVVTVPASFNDAQRSATATAGAIAGLTVVRVLNEPTAAALAYGHTQKLHEIIAVYDFGGGTFDVTFLALEDQVYQVLGTAGDTFLGGDDLDERLVEKMAAKFLAEHHIDLRTNGVAMMRLRAVAEQAKIELSRRARAVVRIDEIAYGPHGAPLHLQIELSRDEFVKEVADLIDRTFPVCTEALALANLSVDRISDVILVGGTTKVPYVRDQVTRFFGKPPRTDVNPEDAVAVGAALQATALARILARRASSKVRAPAPSPAAAAAPTDALELDPASKPDTSYSVTRPSARDDTVEPGRFPTTSGPLPAPGAPPTGPTGPTGPTSAGDRSPPPWTPSQQLHPLGRFMRPDVAEPPPAPQAPHKTVFGVPVGPTRSTAPAEHDAGATRSSETQARSITATGPESPPPLPSSSAPPGLRARGSGPASQPTMPLVPADQAANPRQPQPTMTPAPSRGLADASEPLAWLAGDSAAETDLHAWAVDKPATTQPMAPTTPLAPPTAPTLVAHIPDPAAASTARGLGVQAIAAEPSPGATARGFQPPQPYPAQAALSPPLAPARPAPLLLEVTPRGLGIATVAGFCEELIRRNSRVPTEIRKLFTTSRDRQDLVRIVVCQGESRRLENNTVIGDLVLQNLPRRPRGETSIEVTFSLDPSGVLHVRARDAQTGVEQRAVLRLVGEVAQEDVASSRDRLQQLQR